MTLLSATFLTMFSVSYVCSVQKQIVFEDTADYGGDEHGSLITAETLEGVINNGGSNANSLTRSAQNRRQVFVPLDIPPKHWQKDPSRPEENCREKFKTPPPTPPPNHNLLSDSDNAQDHHQQSQNGEVSIEAPPVPPHAAMATPKHFYHTLECPSQEVDFDEGEADTSSLRHYHGNYSGSNVGSHGGSKAKSQEEVVVVVNHSPVDHQIKKMFDDPRYAMMVVEDEELMNGWTGRRGVWRSTPSLVPTDLTGRTEGVRRSLRLPHSCGNRENHL